MNCFVNNTLLRLYSIIISAIIIPGTIFGQVTIPGAPVYRDIKAYDDHLTITDREGRPFVNKYDNIEGSPFFIEIYCPAILTLNKGKDYKNVLTKVNLFSHEIFVIDSNNQEIIAAEGLVVNILLTETTGGDNFHFRSGYPATDKNNSFDFYLVLSDGNLQLLKLIRKEIVEQKNVQSGEIRKEFISREEFYTYSNGEIRKLIRNKEDIMEMMKDKELKIIEYVKEKKVIFRNISGLGKLFDYYNSLTGQ
jgi:hypothetical protein